ncbi:glycosyltransferase family 9 protein [Microcoleus sp. FACHB-1515]|uniref:glycosyltransferase family 9 protein n=1 Tax=Cyanophyceae TaxID=3028117 RepID=UPI0016871DB4|nr:glycosyltransferase family 9 protein [Microcoleus sp. FACHB-1515]MBD2091737.1 glycosyltransferase family 9 protein [Microcoleus sp. FACHB-1515]
MRDRLNPQSIVVVRALPGLGDLLCLVPALRALRRAFPHARIALLGLAAARGVADRFAEYVDEWIEFPGFPGIPEVAIDPVRISHFLSQMESFDLALQLHGNGSLMNIFVALLAAKQSAGFYLPDRFCPDPQFYLPYPDDLPEVRRSLHLLKFLGISLQGEQLEFPLTTQEQTIKWPFDRYACLHPGASVASRRWPIDQFAALGDRLATAGFEVVLTGTAIEADLTEAIATRMQHRAINLAGKTDLGSLAVLLQSARLLVCNDTGVSHLAAAMQTPSVVLFSDSDLERWRPIDHQLHRAIDARLYADLGLSRAIEQAFELLQSEYAHA